MCFYKYFKVLQILFVIFFFNINAVQSIKCYSCKSENADDCVTLKNILPTTECTDKCYSFFSNNITYRGCKTDGVTATSCNNNNCKVCADDYCNVIKVPTNRRSCFQCSGTECITPDSSLEYPCVNFVTLNDKCYSVNYNDTVYRGCETDSIEILGRSICAKNDTSCDICTTSGGKACNNYKPYSEPTFSCVKCDSSIDKTCHFKQVTANASKCEKNIQFTEGEYCYTLQVDGNPYNVKRGCLLDESIEFKNECVSNTTYCKSCNNNKNGCNINQELAENCLTCDSATLDCVANITNIPSTTCESVTEENLLGCYHYIEGSSVKRGCVASLRLDLEFLNNCRNGTSTCKICNGDRCNSRTEFQECYKCNSTTDLNCAQITQVDSLDKKMCDEYTDVCQMYTIMNGATERGCDKELESGQCIGVNSYCMICSSTLCNGIRFPRNRMECHTCQISADCASEILSGSGKQFVCENFVFFDKCYTVVDEEGRVYRGCVTDNNEGSKKCEEAGNNCAICNTMGCNYRPISSDATLQCVKCDSTDPGCSWGYEESVAETCINPITIGHTERCFQHKNSQGEITRGCSYDQPEICNDNSNNDQTCEECMSNGCNNRNVVKQSCVMCRSDNPTQSECATTGEGFLPTTCSGDVQLYENRGCYVLRADNTIIRGCANDLVVDRSLCEDNDNYCKICMENGCNTMALSGALSIFQNRIVQTILTFSFILLLKVNMI